MSSFVGRFWSVVGYNMVLFLSGLQEIPRDYYEAAEIDGATIVIVLLVVIMILTAIQKYGEKKWVFYN